VVAGTLATLGALVRGSELESPVTLIVGEVGQRLLRKTIDAAGDRPAAVEVA
jgi:siroheme synthase